MHDRYHLLGFLLLCEGTLVKAFHYKGRSVCGNSGGGRSKALAASFNTNSVDGPRGAAQRSLVLCPLAALGAREPLVLYKGSSKEVVVEPRGRADPASREEMEHSLLRGSAESAWDGTNLYRSCPPGVADLPRRTCRLLRPPLLPVGRCKLTLRS